MSYLVRDLSQDSAEGMQTWGSLLEKWVIAFSVVASASVFRNLVMVKEVITPPILVL